MLAGVLLATVGSAFAATAPAKKASEPPKHYSEWLTRSEMQRELYARFFQSPEMELCDGNRA